MKPFTTNSEGLELSESAVESNLDEQGEKKNRFELMKPFTGRELSKSVDEEQEVVEWDSSLFCSMDDCSITSLMLQLSEEEEEEAE